ncbi:hypothetical protein DFH28DRAFT_925563 [Melampsora americana]|nr:hypothetical protein DFH28DRAFT_925563 [Melampsora americana]
MIDLNLFIILFFSPTFERPYDPRGYGCGPRYDHRGGGGGYDRRELRFDDRGPPGRDDRYGYAAPMRSERERYDDRDYNRSFKSVTTNLERVTVGSSVKRLSGKR